MPPPWWVDLLQWRTHSPTGGGPPTAHGRWVPLHGGQGSISLEYQTCTSPHPFDTLVTGMPQPPQPTMSQKPQPTRPVNVSILPAQPTMSKYYQPTQPSSFVHIFFPWNWLCQKCEWTVMGWYVQASKSTGKKKVRKKHGRTIEWHFIINQRNAMIQLSSP